MPRRSEVQSVSKWKTWRGFYRVSIFRQDKIQLQTQGGVFCSQAQDCYPWRRLLEPRILFGMKTSSAKPTNYWEYIRVQELLGLQKGLEEDDSALTNEEVLFITVHQVFELWFKLLLREMRLQLRQRVRRGHVGHQSHVDHA